MSQRGVTIGADDGLVLLLGTDNGTLDGIVITDSVVIDVIGCFTEGNTLGDDRSIGFTLNESAL